MYHQSSRCLSKKKDICYISSRYVSTTIAKDGTEIQRDNDSLTIRLNQVLKLSNDITKMDFAFQNKSKSERKVNFKGNHPSKPIYFNFKNPLHYKVGSLNLTDQEKPPQLSHGLNRCLYQPMAIIPLKDERSNVYNFTPFLENVIKVENFNFDAISKFTTPSQDRKLIKLANVYNKQYISSTSSMTGILSHLHFLISNFRPLSLNGLSNFFPEPNTNFTTAARLPTSVIIRRMDTENDLFSISSDKSISQDIILSRLGHCLETLFTTEESKFIETFDKVNGSKNTNQSRHLDHYHYFTGGNFLIRSQLDAFDPKLPGTGVFDLKTRAVAAVRHDILHIENNNNFTGYQIDSQLGSFESFEREFYDMMRSVLLKYSLQVRLGNMDGIFVAYHNISKIFGFQYIPLEEMDFILHSHFDNTAKKSLDKRDNTLRAVYGDDTYVNKFRFENNYRKIASTMATAEFNFSMQLLDQILTEIKKQLPPNFRAARLVFKTTHENHSTTSKCTELEKRPSLNILVSELNESQLSFFENCDLPKTLSTNDNAYKESINKYITTLKEVHNSIKPATKCFKITLNHSMLETKNHIPIPYYKRFNKDTQNFISESVSQNYLNQVPSWKHPFFFHPSHVNRWQIESLVTISSNKNNIERLYDNLLNEQLNLLNDRASWRSESQSNDFESIANRVTKITEGKSLDTPKKYDSDGGISPLQGLLRAFGKKGLNGSNDGRENKLVQKVMWNDHRASTDENIHGSNEGGTQQ